jgi:Protein of unknown function (DUF3105)
VINARRWAAHIALAAGVVAVTSGCGSSGSDGDDGSEPSRTSTTESSDSSVVESVCGPIVEERLDPTYLVHVVGAGEDVEYTSDPPTSGPHKAGPPVEGVVNEPLSRPVQVGILERGDVLVQHTPDLTSEEQADLATLAGPGVVIAPNADLPAPVVATAWTYKRTCDAVDLAALQGFIDERRGKGPDD